jgi:hypothetical protein
MFKNEYPDNMNESAAAALIVIVISSPALRINSDSTVITSLVNDCSVCFHNRSGAPLTFIEIGSRTRDPEPFKSVIENDI